MSKKCQDFCCTHNFWAVLWLYFAEQLGDDENGKRVRMARSTGLQVLLNTVWFRLSLFKIKDNNSSFCFDGKPTNDSTEVNIYKYYF